jgi:hypothetical protein
MITAFEDSFGRLHKTPEEAVAADLQTLFPDMEGASLSIAMRILRERQLIGDLYCKLDEMKRQQAGEA